MVSFKSLFSFVAGFTAVNRSQSQGGKGQDGVLPDCGELNVLYTGLPPYHPFVAEQGWNPVVVDAALKKDVADAVAAGYNIHVVYAGPEWPLDDFAKYVESTTWDVTGIGFGVRGSRIADVVTLFEDELMVFRQKAPNAYTVFNRGPDTLLWSIQRRFPLRSDCKGRPGKLIGFTELCDERCLVPGPAHDDL